MAYGNYVNNTVEQFGGDLSRPTKFRVFMTLPPKLKLNEAGQFSNKLNILAKNFSIPEIKNDPIEIKYKGHSIPIIGKSNFVQLFSITFYLDETHILRDILSNWIKELDENILGKNNGYLNNNGGIERYGNLVIESLNYDENSPTRKFEFFNIYPVSVGGLEYNTESASAIQEVTVDFSYTHFKSTKGEYDLSNIFEDFITESVDNLLENIFGDDDTESIKSKTVAVVDIFQKGIN
jgi:hypothetical protein